VNLLRWLRRSSSPLGLDDWANYFNFNGLSYPLGPSTTLGAKAEEIPPNFEGYVQGIYKANGVVFACMLVRLLLFSEARFQFRRIQSGRPGELFGTTALRTLEQPWPGGTTGDLLTRAIQDADLAGNFYAVRRPGRIRRLRPDWMTIVLGSEQEPQADIGAGDIDAEVIGYVYQPGGPRSGAKPVPLLRQQVAHFAPIPDPAASFRGMSWLTPVIRELMADGAATTHKLKFFENGATPNLVVSLDPSIEREAFERWIKTFEDSHEGVLNAYKTLYLGGGANVEVVGKDLRQLQFKDTQGAGETRIAAAAGVPPVIVGLSEGLEAATYSNYGQARRRFADGTMRPLWRNMAGSLATIVDVPAAAELWYDDRDISFLQEDLKDAAEIQQVQAQAIKALTEAGFRPEAVVEAIVAGDLGRLDHTGLFSVQLRPAGAGDPNANGVAAQRVREALAGLLHGNTED
jgi:phage portal protein BeeE